MRHFKTALLTCSSKLDLTPHDVLAKWILYMLQNRVNSEVASADPEQGGMLAFSRHIAAELSKPAVIASYPELGNKLTSYIESRTAVGSGPLGGPMLNIIGRHFDYDREAGAGLRQMLYLSHAPDGTSFKQLQAHMEHIVYLDAEIA